MPEQEPIINPIWAVRFLPGLATVLVAISFFAGSHETLRSMAIGGALGLLISFSVFSLQIKQVVLRETPQPSNVQYNPIT